MQSKWSIEARQILPDKRRPITTDYREHTTRRSCGSTAANAIHASGAFVQSLSHDGSLNVQGCEMRNPGTSGPSIKKQWCTTAFISCQTAAIIVRGVTHIRGAISAFYHVPDSTPGQRVAKPKITGHHLITALPYDDPVPPVVSSLPAVAEEPSMGNTRKL